MNRSLARILSALSIALAGAARAQEHPAGHEGGHAAEAAHEGHGGGEYPVALIERPLELPMGMVEVEANLLAYLFSGVTVGGETFGGPFKPTYLGFGVAYGVTNQLQVALSSSGFCLTGTSGGCGHVFDDLAAEVAFGVLHQKGLQVSLQAGLEFAHLAGGTAAVDTPLEIAGGIGIDLRAVSGQFALRAGPKLTFGLKERSGFNREFLVVPLVFQFQANQHLALEAGLALNLLLDPPDPLGFFDYVRVPVSVGALYALSNKLDVGGSFVFTNLLGKSSAGPNGIDGRALQIFVNFRL